MSICRPRSHSARTAPSKASGTARMTMKGIDQLSYCAATKRKTNTIARAKTIAATEPAFSSWYVQFDTRDVVQPKRRLARGSGAKHDVAELLRVAQSARAVDLVIEHGARRRRVFAELAGCDLGVL